MKQKYETIVNNYFAKLLNNDVLNTFAKEGLLVADIAKDLYENRHYDLVKGLYLISVYALVEDNEQDVNVLEKLNEDIAHLIEDKRSVCHMTLVFTKEGGFGKKVVKMASQYITDEEIKKDLVA